MVNRETRGRPGSPAERPFAALASVEASGYSHRMRLDQLREDLLQHRPADSREAGFVTRMLELTRNAAACERSQFEPGHFTASAFVLSPDRRDLLLIHHKKLGIWVQPGGHVESTDPNLLGAARREVLEEVGLDDLKPFSNGNSPLFDVDIHRIPARKAELEHEHFDVRFAFVAKTRELVRSEEVSDLRWVPLDAVESVGSDQSVLRAVQKLRTLLA